MHGGVWDEGVQAKSERQKYLARAVGSSGKKAEVDKGEEGKKWSCRIELSVVRKVAFYEGCQRWKARHAAKLLPKVAKLTLNINKNVAKGSCR